MVLGRRCVSGVVCWLELGLGIGSLVLLALGFTGCGTASRSSQLAHAGPALRGMVRGGQQAVVGATIQLYAASSDGYGAAATPLIASTVQTGSSGSFNISGDYSCPSPSSQVYLVATGGNPGLAEGTNNSALAMMAALGDCGNLSASTFIWVNEVTTVGSVYALAQFMSPGGGANLGTSSGNVLGLANAFATVKNLVNTRTGKTPGPTLPTGATAPTSELNTLADILATCINSDGVSGACSALFTAATPNGGSAPTNTIDAVLDIALHPGQNVSALYSLVTGTPPFQPTLSAVPNDWTVAVFYKGGGLDEPLSLAIDGQGNVWTGNVGDSSTPDSLSKFSPTGTARSPSVGFTDEALYGSPFTIAIDTSGNVWATNEALSKLIKFSNSGTPLSPSTGYTGGGLDAPNGIAIDGSNDVWVTNSESLSKFANDGTPISPPSGYTGGGLNQPYYDIAIDGSGDVWVPGGGAPFDLSEFSNSGVPISPSSGYADGLLFPAGTAIDASGNVWVNTQTGLCELSNEGVLLSSSGCTAGVGSYFYLAVDGAGDLWSTTIEFSRAGMLISPPGGYRLSQPGDWSAMAVDSSGNLWVASGPDGRLIAEIVGAAAPVMTPLAAAVKNNKLGQRP